MKNTLLNARHYFFGLLMLATLLTILILTHPTVFTLADEIIPVRSIVGASFALSANWLSVVPIS